MFNFIKNINEGRTLTKLKQIKLDYSIDSLSPSLSKDIMEFHFGTLYKAYVDRYNKGEGDADFNEDGAFLHSVYFEQFRSPDGPNKPEDASLEFINTHFKSWDKFKDAFEKEAMAIQGSGWCYLAKNGEIKTIKNHEIRKDIVLIIDWWEHAFQLDFGSDKKKYLEGQWRIINWSVINDRLDSKNK